MGGVVLVVGRKGIVMIRVVVDVVVSRSGSSSHGRRSSRR